MRDPLDEPEYGECQFCGNTRYLYIGIMEADGPFSPTCVSCIFLMSYLKERVMTAVY